MAAVTNEIPLGLCQCGCGQKTTIATQDDLRYGTLKGEPQRWLQGHNRRTTLTPYLENPESGCWEWQQAKNPQGYGKLTKKGRSVPAHRWYFEQARGTVPDGKELHHLCENKGCVNPDHLEAVTRAEHVRKPEDRRSVLTEAEVKQIRTSSLSGAALARRFGVCDDAVLCVRRGETWVGVA